MPAGATVLGPGRDAALVKQAEPGKVANRAARLNDTGGYVNESVDWLAFRRRRQHRTRSVEKHRAAYRHLALKLLGYQAVAAGRDFPGDGARRVARQVLTQVE